MKERSQTASFLQQLEMVWFRGFDRFLLSELHPFTIIGGRNNVGKTSILEAMYYLANRSVGVAPGRLMLGRKMSLKRRDLFLPESGESRSGALLRLIGCANRLVCPTEKGVEELQQILTAPLPDYSSVLEAERAKSLAWLERCARPLRHLL